MQKIKYFLFVVISAFSMNIHALEPVLDHQAYFYLNIPLDRANKEQGKYNFGFALDRAFIQVNTPVDLAPNAGRPALFELAMNQNGIKSFAINGVRFADDFYVYRGNVQNNEEITTEENGATISDAEDAETENGETTADLETEDAETGETAEQKPEKEHGKITSAILNAGKDEQIGIAIGFIISAFLLAGDA